MDRLMSDMHEQAKSGEYLLLLANLNLCVAFICKEERVDIDKDLLDKLEIFFLTIDKKAIEYHFRGYLRNYLTPSFQKLLEKRGFTEFFKNLKEKKLRQRHELFRLNDHKNHAFTEFFVSGEDRFSILKEQQIYRIESLQADEDNEAYTVFCRIIVAYWRVIRSQLPLVFKDSDITALLTLGESLWYLIKHEISDQETLWCYALLLQELLVDFYKNTELPTTPSDLDPLLLNCGYLKSTLLLYTIAIKISTSLDSNQRMDWLHKALTINKSTSCQPQILSCPLLKDYRNDLKQIREVFEKHEKPYRALFTAQKQHSEQSIDLLNTFLIASAEVLGPPPCDVAFCILGSTSRGDRRPYSDIEVLVLYESTLPSDKNSPAPGDKVSTPSDKKSPAPGDKVSPPLDKKSPPGDKIPPPSGKKSPAPGEVAPGDRVDAYVFQLICCIELMIVRLGETHTKSQPNAGFHFDSSSHVLFNVKSTNLGKSVKRWGTPDEIIQAFILDLDCESWVDDESFYSFLNPRLINHDHLRGEKVFKNYQEKIQLFLKEIIPKDQVEILEKQMGINQMGITQKNSLATLKRHEIIALGCFWDVLSKSVESLKELKIGEKFDLKQVYYKPLAYFALNLRMFYQLDAMHPADIFEAIKGEYIKDGDAIVTLLTHALSFVVQHQVKLHLAKKHQEEDIVYTIDTESEKELWAGLDLIGRGIIMPLDQALKKSLSQGKFDFKRLGLKALRGYVDIRERWLEDWEKKGCPKVDLLEHPLIIPLETYPSREGKRASNILNQMAWQNTLKQYFIPTPPTEKTNITVTIGSLILTDTTGYLNPTMLQDLITHGWIKKNGQFLSKPEKENHPMANLLPGNHLVIPYPIPENMYTMVNKGHKTLTKNQKKQILTDIALQAKIYLKVFPEYPLLELLLNYFTEQLGRYPARRLDLWSWVTTYNKNNKKKTTRYPVLVSEVVPGPLLQTILENSVRFHLDPHAFSENVLLSSLVGFEDSKPDNCIVVNITTKDARLCRIDAERCFVAPFNGDKLNVKEILFCLPEMSNNVSQEVMEAFLALDPEKTLGHWIEKMNYFGSRCIQLFGEEQIKAFYTAEIPKFQLVGYLFKPSVNQSLLLPPLDKSIFVQLLERLRAVRLLFQTVITTHSQHTHWQLLAEINPRMANHYYQQFQMGENTLINFREVVGNAYDKSHGEMFSTHMNKTQAQDWWTRPIPTDDMASHWVNTIKEIGLWLPTIEISTKILESAEQGLKEGNVQKFLALPPLNQNQLLNQMASKHLGMTTTVQKGLIEAIIQFTDCQYLQFFHFSNLTNDHIRQLLRQNIAVHGLLIDRCPLVSEIFPPNGLQKLQLRKLPELKSLYFYLPSLVKLRIQECVQLEDITIQAPVLHTLTIENTPVLKKLQTESKHLRYVRFKGKNEFTFNKWHTIVPRNSLVRLASIRWVDSPTDITYLQHYPVLLGIEWTRYSRETREEMVKRFQIYLTNPLLGNKIGTPILKQEKKNKTKKIKVFENKKDENEKEEEKVIEDLLNEYEKVDDKQRFNLLTKVEALLMEVETWTEAISLIKQNLSTSQLVPVEVKQPVITKPVPTEHSIDTLAQTLLKNQYPDTRVKAVMSLPLTPSTGPVVFKILVKALKDADWHVRKAAVERLGCLETNDLEKLPHVITTLANEVDSDTFTQIVNTLVQMGKQNYKIVPQILKGYEDMGQSFQVRLYLAGSLMHLGQGSPKIIDFLLEKGIIDKNAPIRATSALALGQSMQSLLKVTSGLLPLMIDQKEEVKTSTIQALALLYHTIQQTMTLRFENFFTEIANNLVPQKPTPTNNVPQKATAPLFFISPRQNPLPTEPEDQETDYNG